MDDDDDKVIWPLSFEALLSAFHDDSVTALEIEVGQLKSLGFDVNLQFVLDGTPVDETYTLLGIAVRTQAVKCIVYLNEIGADPYQKGIDVSVDSEKPWMSGFYSSLEADEWNDENWVGTTEYEFAKEMWTKFVSAKYKMSEKVCRDLINVAGQNWLTFRRAPDNEPYVHIYTRSPGIEENGIGNHKIGRIRIWTDDDTYETVYLCNCYLFDYINSIQYAIQEHGRDSHITRLLRGESKTITKSYKVAFKALHCYADSQRAKNDGRLLLILKGLSIVNMPPELREKIVNYAFFR